MSLESFVLSATQLSFSYGRETILEDVSFAIPEGDYVGIIGPNGGGKTTLLKLMLGLLAPSKGTIEISKNARIGYVAQRVGLNGFDFPVSVSELVGSARVGVSGIFSFSSAHDREVSITAMKRTGIFDLEHRLVSELSGGQRQRVFIARALALEPSILFLDEPSVGIDAASTEQFYSLLSTLNSDYGITIVVVSHDIDMISKEVKTVLCLNKRLVCQGNYQESVTPQTMEALYGKKAAFVLHAH